jgi:hypothetical protein
MNGTSPSSDSPESNSSSALSERELATVLAALRSWQAGSHEPAELSEHFDDCEPLSPDEIDELCGRLNGGPPTPDATVNQRRAYKAEVRKSEVVHFRGIVDITAASLREARAAVETMLSTDEDSISWTEVGAECKILAIDRVTEAS